MLFFVKITKCNVFLTFLSLDFISFLCYTELSNGKERMYANLKDLMVVAFIDVQNWTVHLWWRICDDWNS